MKIKRCKGAGMNNNKVKFCSRCIMNSKVDPSIVFDEQGVCKHCLRYDLLCESRTEKNVLVLEQLKNKIKKEW